MNNDNDDLGYKRRQLHLHNRCKRKSLYFQHDAQF